MVIIMSLACKVYLNVTVNPSELDKTHRTQSLRQSIHLIFFPRIVVISFTMFLRKYSVCAGTIREFCRSQVISSYRLLASEQYNEPIYRTTYIGFSIDIHRFS